MGVQFAELQSGGVRYQTQAALASRPVIDHHVEQPCRIQHGIPWLDLLREFSLGGPLMVYQVYRGQTGGKPFEGNGMNSSKRL